ncbi:hypothetical protein GBA52_017808 [Prunus armeniaca]|nr:hypothetical protein GBA52_017808 [Prunus armeniaca]
MVVRWFGLKEKRGFGGVVGDDLGDLVGIILNNGSGWKFSYSSFTLVSRRLAAVLGLSVRDSGLGGIAHVTHGGCSGWILRKTTVGRNCDVAWILFLCAQ